MNLTRPLMVLSFGLLLLTSTPIWAQSTNRASMLKEIETLRSQLKSREDAFLAPSPEDRQDFSDFLQQKDTGLVRLLPREEYDAKHKLTIRGGGAYYSFTQLTHEYGYGSDIELQMERLSVGFAGADYGMLANLGDIPLDNITLDLPAVQVLAQHTPPTLIAKARIEQRRSSDGVTVENVLYKSYLPAVVNSTYILRSVNYETSDVLVAFRVVRKDTDGSLILMWKMLKKYEVPRLKREDIAKEQ